MRERLDVGQIDLNLLYTFRVVCELGGVGAAARELGRTQPAISGRVRQLEEALGVRLFDRAGRGLELSPAGRFIEEEVRAVLQGVHRILDRTRMVASQPAGVLRIGALPTLSAYVLAPCVADFLDAHPAAQVEIETGLTGAHLDMLHDGKLDLVVAVGPIPKAKRVDVVPIGAVRPVLVLPSNAAGTGRRPISVAKLATLRLIGYGHIGDLFFDEVWRFLERHGLAHSARLRVANIHSLKELVLLGAGVTILPHYTVVEPGLATRPVQGLSFTHPVWVALRTTSRDVALVKRFVDRLPVWAQRRLEGRR